MHRITGGLLTIVAFLLAFVSPAAAQISGHIDTIGFGGRYRPGCWTPLLVKITLAGATPGNYELRVWQHDLDGDLPYFSRPITLSGNANEQGFWTAFLPEPIHGGLTNGNSVSGELASKLRVTVNDASGKELAQIPLARATADSVDPDSGPYTKGRASRFVLFIGTGAAPPLKDYGEHDNILGIKEDLADVRLEPEQLPEAAIAYEGVDAIVWLGGDPAELGKGNGDRLNAIRDYVRRGGHLVLATPAEDWQQLLGFGDLLPVDISGTELNVQQSPLRDLTDRMAFPARNIPGAPRTNPWTHNDVSMTLATATPRPGAVVDLYADRVANPQGEKDQTPWLVRHSYGFGCVSWVGQGLGSPVLSNRLNWGWPEVWETVLGADDSPNVWPSPSIKARFEANARRDVGFTILDSMNLTGRAAQLIGITILFFIGYWLLAGPGTFFWLRYKGRATLNWFAFGAMALVATAMTLLLVKLIVRGSPEVKHVSLVRIDMADASTPSIATSRLGMYIPRDGPQSIALRDADLAFGPTVTPFPIHPAMHSMRDGDRYLYAAPREYRVNVPSGDSGEAAAAGRSPAATDIPFRTTMKRLRAQWFGPREERINGDAALQMGSVLISGTLRNQTGHDLRNVYLAFRYQTPGGIASNWIMYVLNWKDGTPLDLGQCFLPNGKTLMDVTVGTDQGDAQPGGDIPVHGRTIDWGEIFARAPKLTANTIGLDEVGVHDFDVDLPLSVPLLSFFNALPPAENESRGGEYTKTRADLFRSGLREWDISNALMAGRLVIVAQADHVPIPLPLDVDSSKVEGTGTTIYQFVLPLKPVPAEPPSTRPTSQPATQSTH